MDFDIGSAFGGGLSGAAAGSALGPWGTLAGGIAGLVGGGFAGGSTPTYQPSDLQQSLMNYAGTQTRANKQTRKGILAKYQGMVDEGNRGGAEAFLEQYKDRYTNPEFIWKHLKKSYSKPIDYGQDSYWQEANKAYGQQGLGFSAQDFDNFIAQAKGRGIRSPQAFGDMLKSDLVASGKVLTPQQEMLSYIWGTPARDPVTQKYTNLYRAIKPITGEDIKSLFGTSTAPVTTTTTAA